MKARVYEYTTSIGSPPPIPLHAIAAFFAIVLGAWQLFTKKGNQSHKYVGYLWVLLMLYVSISSFWIHSIKLIGLFSPIHLLSLFTIWTLYEAIKAARQHQISKHQKMMKRLYVLGLALTGLFTLLPNRIMNEVIFMS
ncbi:DUF2306 domain-containing protein [Vibrio ostreicida]|uniref:DUF2306 domain-containing protein n=1 Tax=Vibrio ostreicida TaxID=526588 RepID=UPI00349F1410